MNILAFESSSHRVSVALWRDGAIQQRFEDLPNGGSERLLPWTSELLAEAGLSLGEVSGIAFGAGPGAFTGLRLACSVAQGLAFGLGLKVAPVSTLEALALATCPQGTGKLCACLDARMNEVYYAAYHIDGDCVTTISPPACALPVDVVLPPGEDWVGCGDGFAAYPELLRSQLVAIHAGMRPMAAEVARLGAQLFARGGGVDAAQALPLYVRDKVALTTAERLLRGGSK